jgi:hypothetical protein
VNKWALASMFSKKSRCADVARALKFNETMSTRALCQAAGMSRQNHYKQAKAQTRREIDEELIVQLLTPGIRLLWQFKLSFRMACSGDDGAFGNSVGENLADQSRDSGSPRHWRT